MACKLKNEITTLQYHPCPQDAGRNWYVPALCPKPLDVAQQPLFFPCFNIPMTPEVLIPLARLVGATKDRPGKQGQRGKIKMKQVAVLTSPNRTVSTVTTTLVPVSEIDVPRVPSSCRKFVIPTLVVFVFCRSAAVLPLNDLAVILLGGLLSGQHRLFTLAFRFRHIWSHLSTAQPQSRLFISDHSSCGVAP